MPNTAASKPASASTAVGAALSIEEAKTLARTLRRTLRTMTGTVSITARVEEVEERVGWRTLQVGRIHFEGGKSGSHSLWLSVSTRERVLAHFEGYCESNGCARPVVGQTVEFPSASAWRVGGYRKGRVVAVGRTRATVAYRFAHGGETTKSVSFHELRMYV